MPTLSSGLTLDEIANRGQALYEQRLRKELEKTYFGQYLVIDIDSGEYEIGADHLRTARKARARNPNAALYGLKIGYPATVAIGGTLRPLEESNSGI